MFKGLKDMGSLMKQAKEMKSQMSKVQEGLKKMAFSGTALQGKIEITVNGELDILNVKIDPSVLNSEKAPQLEKAIKEAAIQAMKLAKDSAASQLSAIAGNLNLPGLS